MKFFLRIFNVILLALIAVKCESKAEGFSCPDLIMSKNNWEIEQFFGTWSAVESFMHVENGMVKAEELCASMVISEVNESGESMTYTKSADPFNSRQEQRYLEIKFNDETNSRSFTYILSFYNEKKMYWTGNDTIIQVIKFEKNILGGMNLMATICKPKEKLSYSILYDNRNDEKIAGDGSTRLSHLILMQRNLKEIAKFECITNAKHETSPISTSNFSSKLKAFSSLIAFSVLILLEMTNVFLVI